MADTFTNIPDRDSGDPASAADINQFMENLRAIIGNGTSAPTNTMEELYSSIAAIVQTPPGTVAMTARTTAPTGWLLCDGSAISRTTYSALFAAIGTTYGIGDGSTTFNIPDFGGIFPRGAGTNGTLSDSSSTAFTATLGTYQNDAMQRITGTWAYSDPDDPISTGICGHTSGGGGNRILGDGSNGSYTLTLDSDDSTSPNAARTDDAETRPANLAINFKIKT